MDSSSARISRPLHDSPNRSYAEKLERFARFAEPEIRQLFRDLRIAEGSAVLDLGCGVGLATHWLAEEVGTRSTVIGADLSFPHLQAAARLHPGRLVQCDIERACFRDRSFDLVWSCNTFNHLESPVDALRKLRDAIRVGGRIVLAQSNFLPEMYFAWDAPLDENVRRACHAYYRDRYGLGVDDTGAVRGLMGQLQAAGYTQLRVRTYAIERTQPLAAEDLTYFSLTVFRDTWGERVKPYLEAEEWERLRRYVDPASHEYCLSRRDFHHVQTLTMCEARA
jgi:SAM-dependent methyltransferase